MHKFFAILDHLSSGDRATLRHACGTMLHEADGKSFAIFYRCLKQVEPIEEWKEERWFAAACIHCLWRADAPSGMTMQQVLARLRNVSSSTEQRLIGLLDMQWDESGYFLTKLVRLLKLAKQKGYRVDSKALLSDLCYWNASQRAVQIRWANGLYSDIKTTTTTQEGE